MSGSGHVLDMINRMKQNRAQRPSVRAKFKERNREEIYTSEKLSERPHFKIVSASQLNEIKKRIRTRAKYDQKKERLVYAMTLIIGLLFLIGLLIWLN
jgi:hypothetical protein